jgi:hypothetical protein
MFGDWSWVSQRTEAQQARFDSWVSGLSNSSPRLAVVELGAGSAVPTVRLTSETVARQFSGTLIRINPREPDVPEGQIGLALGAAEGVRQIGGLIGALGRPLTHRPGL